MAKGKTKRTYQPSKRRRSRRFGFLARKRKSQNVLKSRRAKKRSRLSPASSK